MKLLMILLMLLIPQSAYGAMGACHDGNGNITQLDGENALGTLYTTTANCILYDTEFNGTAPQTTELTTAEYINLQNLIKSLPKKYFKFANGLPTEMTAGEKAVVDAAEAVITAANTRAEAKVLLDGFVSQQLYNRAEADILKDEINILRQWIESFKTQTAASSNLSDFKSRVAGLPSMPDRTLAQFKTAIKNRIDDGSVDNS